MLSTGGVKMAKRDQLTGKGSLTGNTRSHAMNHSKRR